MDALLETLEHPATPPATRHRNRLGAVHAPPPSPVLMPWLQAQSVNVNRHAAALRPFRRDEFGTGAASPTEAHLHAANDLSRSLRTGLLRLTHKVTSAVDAATGEPTTPFLQQVVRRKERAHNWVRAIERIWDFYFELFGQRQSEFADWLLSCDRIALDCYQYVYLGLGVAKSIPAPPPFSYMRTGFSPAACRCGVWGSRSIRFRSSSCPITAW